MKKSLIRSIPYWILIVLSLGSGGFGAWLITDQLTTMTATLLDGTATGVEVYVGQSWAVVGAALVGAGIIGLLLALGIAAAKTFVGSAPAVHATPAAEITPVDQEVEKELDEEIDEPVAAVEEPELSEVRTTAEDAATEDQNGSSGSIATATNINVR